MKRLSNSMGPAGLIVAAMALVVAMCGGTAVAATLITTSQIKNGAVTNPKLAANAVTGGKVADGSLTLNDLNATARSAILNSHPNTVTVISPDVTVTPGATLSAYATCPSGTRVTGGGFFSSIAHAGISVPYGNNAWTVTVNNDTSFTVTINAWAVCA